MDQGIITFFGLNPMDVAAVIAIVLLVVEYAKTVAPKVFVGGITSLAAAVVGFAISAAKFWPDWKTMLAMTLMSVIGAGGLKTIAKKIGQGA